MRTCETLVVHELHALGEAGTGGAHDFSSVRDTLQQCKECGLSACLSGWSAAFQVGQA